MPLYEYECENCGSRFDRFCSMDSRHSAECDDCGHIARLRISPSIFRFEVPLSLFTHDGKRLERQPKGGEVPDPRPPTHNLREV